MVNNAANTSINMQGVDTIVAVPQWYVNFNLANILQTGKTTTGGSLKDVSIGLKNQQNFYLKAVIGSLSTVLHVEGSTTQVVFMVSFTSGSLDYYDLDVSPPERKAADVSGVSFAFLVDLSIKDLENDANLPANVKAEVKARMSNLGPGAFTIQQFFMDLTESAVSRVDQTHTVFPETFPPSARITIKNYLAVYIDQIRQTGGHILGYSVKVQNPGGVSDPVASFPPTALMLVTNQYTPGNGENPDSETADLDTINYLMMTGAKPVFPSNLKPWWGNFIVPGDDKTGRYGTMAMESNLFIREFLLKRLAPIVCTYAELSDQNDSLDMKYTTKAGKFTPTALGGTWSSGELSSKSHKSGDDAWYTFNFNVDLSVDPGAGTIVIKRNTNFSVKVDTSSTFQVWYEIPLTLTISLTGIDKGALQVSVDEKTKQKAPHTLYGDPYGWLITKVQGDWPIWVWSGDTLEQTIDKAIGAAVPEAVPANITETIKNTLNPAPFVFPGGAELFMKDPVFSSSGDLLISLQYKG